MPCPNSKINKETQELIEEFIFYIQHIRGYPLTTIITYKGTLCQLFKVSVFVANKSQWILDITPYRFEIIQNSKKTIAKKLSTIHSFVSYLQKQKKLTIKLISDERVKAPQTLPKPIEKEYIQEVLSSSTLPERLMIELLYGLGLRISELSFIRLTDITNGWIRITGKGDKTRELPLLELISQNISLYLASHHPKEYLFEKDGKPLNSAQLRYIVSKRFKSNGIKATPHQLRHSFATHMLNNGARISDVSELLGHSSMATTQIYTKLAHNKKLDEYLKTHPLVNNTTGQ